MCGNMDGKVDNDISKNDLSESLAVIDSYKIRCPSTPANLPPPCELNVGIGFI